MSVIVGREEFADFSHIKDALQYIKEHKEIDPSITILQGRYHENLTIDVDGIELVGLGDVQIIGSAYAKQVDEVGNEIGTFQTPTVYIEAENAKFSGITFVNDSGHGDIVGQAVAVFVHSDKVFFENCRFLAHQDTLCLGPLPAKQANGSDFPKKNQRRYFDYYRTYFYKCYIEGTIDYIFGGGTGLFHNCEVKSKKRICPADEGFVTAASTPERVEHGLIFFQCKFTAEEGTQNVYLGRPWREFGATRVIDCHFGYHIREEFWSDWPQHCQRLDHVRYSVNVTMGGKENKSRFVFPSWTNLTEEKLSINQLKDQVFMDWLV